LFIIALDYRGLITVSIVAFMRSPTIAPPLVARIILKTAIAVGNIYHLYGAVAGVVHSYRNRGRHIGVFISHNGCAGGRVAHRAFVYHLSFVISRPLVYHAARRYRNQKVKIDIPVGGLRGRGSGTQ
jgi:hypothetical protein